MRLLLASAAALALLSCSRREDALTIDFSLPDQSTASDGRFDQATSMDTAQLDSTLVEDIPPADGIAAYDDLGRSDSGHCTPPSIAAVCNNPVASNAGCLVQESCGPSQAGNGLDDNCNGQVDEGCSCIPGDVQRCFLGPPGKRGIGACAQGSQTCQGLEFGAWGPCVASLSPAAEACDQIDNDCNGCVDDGLCCEGTIKCPSSVPDTLPFATVTYQGASYFVGGQAKSWNWSVAGGPCDRLFAATTGNPPKQSFSLKNALTDSPSFQPTLSGDYVVNMTVTDVANKIYSCRWVQHVAGPGVRFELCWDRTGDVDLDLHVHRSGTTTPWIFPTGKVETDLSKVNADDCHFQNCTAQTLIFPIPGLGPAPANWGYANTSLNHCANTLQDLAWRIYGSCLSPRLDIDNIMEIGKPENINIDTPKSGDKFRAMVHYFGQEGGVSHIPLETHPLVTIYCGGRLKATYGQAPDRLGPCPGATCFDRREDANQFGLMWRVADVTAVVDGSGNTTDCAVQAIHPIGQSSGHFVTKDNASY